MRTLLALMMLGSSSVLSAAKNVEVLLWGVGGTSCGHFIALMEENPQNELTFGQWHQGYITALNSMDRSVVDHAANIDRVGLMTWITNYCKGKPLDSYYEATVNLVHQLRKDGRIKTRIKTQQ